MPSNTSPLPFISEFEGAVSTTPPPGYNASDEEKRILDKVQKCFTKAKRHREKYDQHWIEYYKMFRGKQWTEQRPSYRHSEVINLIFQSIQHTVPILADTRQQIQFNPQEPSDLVLAEILNQVAEYDWRTNNWSHEVLEMIYDAHIYGTAFGSMMFNPKACHGRGDLEFSSEDPFYHFPDPNARDVNKDGEYYIFAEPVDISVLKKEYPEHAEWIKSDISDVSAYSRTDLEDTRYKSPTDTLGTVEGNLGYAIGNKSQALKITCYMNDDEMVEEKQDPNDPISDPNKPTVSYKKYPNGRRCVVVSGMLVENGPNPYEDGKFPYVKLNNYVLPREFWGISEVEQTKGPQKVFNKLVSFALDTLTLMGNPIWIVDDTADLDTDNLFNIPGSIVEKAAGSEVRRESGVQLQPYVLDMISSMERWFNGIAGTNDVSQGAKPAGVQAAEAISLLQEASETRLRQKSRNLDMMIQSLGQLYLSRVFQFYDAPRIVNITNNNETQKYFKFHVTKEMGDDGEEYPVAHVREFQQDPVSGEHVMSTEEKSYPVKGKFDVKISTGSSLPFSKQETLQKSINLFKLGVIDSEELLKNIDYPNWESVLQRMQQKQAEQAQMQAQQPQGAK